MPANTMNLLLGRPRQPFYPHRRWWKQAVALLFLCLVLNYLLLAPNFGFVLPHVDQRGYQVPGFSANHDSHVLPPSRVLNSPGLSEDECKAAFPGLTKDINNHVKLGPFVMTDRSAGLVEVRVKDRQLFVLHSGSDLTPELLDARSATLQQIYRAIITSPSPLPETVITINVHDQPFGAAWSYSRPAYAMPTAGGAPITRAFLMPHFSFWAWPQPFIGSLPRAAAAIDAIEASLPFSQKDARLVWRGTVGFNSAHHPTLREDLITAAHGKPWADVAALRWNRGEGGANGTAMPSNALMVEDFCRHKYVLHTEGVTYSGRLPFLQMCRSVLLTPPLAWLQHTTHLVRPLFSADLDLEGGASRSNSSKTPPRWTPSGGENTAWPKHFTPGEANAVFVSPDWSDLEATVAWLERHPDVAEGIAERQRELFVGGGYFSLAAEACYWRALVRGWSTVVGARTLEEDGGMEESVVRWEEFVLRPR
ncbi:hypothetical protein B0T24DRAFT_671116 [Lasiosphaeria ovina]|uniref:Glycosyl transferase CAP10 domain-containing protein n=1 Tax=Lasiosphaeria ovina TaxID=92902 RepID=A0AAE0JTR0_9PEZI|nr:hypothetical protein B0T24DRAFT_671116 [Lasiosphaeria ovina]